MNVKALFGSVLSLFLLTAALQAQSRETLLKYLNENPAWEPSAAARQYNEATVDTFAGKTASTLKRYGLTGITVQDWTGSEGRVRLTLYEMIDPSAAYGFFTFQRNPDQPDFSSVPLGTEAFRNSKRTYFWQSKYVVQLDGDAAAADALGRVVSQNIFGRSLKPPVADHLPLNHLVQDTQKYVVDEAGMDPHLGLDASMLGFDDDVEIATARYQVDGKTANLVLFYYPTQHLAKKHEDAWDVSLPGDAPFRKRVGPLIAWVRGSDDAKVAEEILSAVGYESQATWTEPQPDLSIRTVILTIFTFTGIALLFTFVAGVSFGGLRIFLKARYPDRIFDRPEDMEIIQLKLAEGFTRKELRP
jgi:Family of unknown function (DUF6599)